MLDAIKSYIAFSAGGPIPFPKRSWSYRRGSSGSSNNQSEKNQKGRRKDAGIRRRHRHRGAPKKNEGSAARPFDFCCRFK